MQVQHSPDVTILCPMCGIKFLPVLGNICEACALAKTDITIGITKQSLVNFCRFCHRYMRPPWVFCERDSKDLLALLLKKVKGLNKTKIINAGFIWTQPHAKRIKLKITIEKEMNNSMKIEQTFVTEFVEVYTQCDDCKKQFTPHTWGAVVQVRQHVDHKKTFYLVQQLILKHNVYDKVLKVSVEDDGINFYYKNTTHAQRLIDFLHLILPITVKTSKQLISHDMNSNTFVYKYAFAVDLPKICKNDLVVIPKKLAKEMGCSQLLLCEKVSQNMGFLDLVNFNYVLMSNIQYYHYEKDIQMLPLSRYRQQFEILDCNPVDKAKYRQLKSTLNKYASKVHQYNVTRRGEWENIEVKGAIGLLHCTNIVQGFDMRYLNHAEEFGELKGYQDIVLVRRVKGKNHGRAFKLKRLEDQGVMIEEKEPKKHKKHMKEDNEDFQNFMDDIEADKQLQKGLKLYKNDVVLKNMNKEQLQEVIAEMEIADLLEDMNINEQPSNKAVENDADGIDELIAKMDKVNIDKQ